MEATRFRLRLVTGVTLDATTYGSGNYGSGTYGQEATDPLTALRYWLVPWGGGYLTEPAWTYRQGDVLPEFRAQVQSDDGPLALTGLDQARLVLAAPDAPQSPRVYDCTVDSRDGADWIVRQWQDGDLRVPGAFRAAVVLTFTSGRQLSVPIDDRLTFQVSPNPLVATALGARWDQARWDLADWS